MVIYLLTTIKPKYYFSYAVKYKISYNIIRTLSIPQSANTLHGCAFSDFTDYFLKQRFTRILRKGKYEIQGIK